MSALVTLEDVHRTFRVGDQDVRALDGVDLTIRAGEYVSIMGPSGSGKSTLLHLLGLLDRPTLGCYRLAGRDVTALSDDERARVRGEQIGFVFQFFHLVPRLSAAENIELPLVLAGVAPAERRRRVARVIEAMGLTDRAGHLPGQLSGGQRQRVAIGRATVTEPAVLLADEPTGNLDRASGEDVVRVLEALNGRGITQVVVTHDLDLGARARRRIRMVDGRVVEDVRADAAGATP